MISFAMKKKIAAVTTIILICGCIQNVSQVPKPVGTQCINSIGMKFVRIEPGTFMMGTDPDNPIPDGVMHEGVGRRGRDGDYDEQSYHKVTITKPFYCGITEVTIDQFRQFRPNYTGYDEYVPYAAGISWHDAVAFCQWLSKKEGRTYRLPTEAEWEYVCRAGTTTAFSSGNAPPDPETPNHWGVKNMHTNVLEWCNDWHGLYPATAQVDPVGPEHGWVKVVRGGGFDTKSWSLPYYARSANRAAIAPAWGPPPKLYQAKMVEGLNMPFSTVTYNSCRSGIPGRHPIGFRVVLAEMPMTKPALFEPSSLMRCVKQKTPDLGQGPDLDKPFYIVRRMFPIGLDVENVGWKIGIEPGNWPDHHNSALTQLSNGDLLAFYYNRADGTGERDPDLSVVALRLRRGAASWDLPSPWPDFLDANDEAPVIWNDNGTLWLFWGCPRMKETYPFQYVKSTDNGATWGPVEFPIFETWIHPHSHQPINSVFRSPDDTVHIGVDGAGATSVLYAGRDGGKIWSDPGGRTTGRHSTFVLLDDDKTVLAYGGKISHIEGFMPVNISRDFGKTWEVSKSPVSRLGGGQRASLIKLASGRLFLTTDLRECWGEYCEEAAADPAISQDRLPKAELLPEVFSGNGGYAAISDDNGKTWKTRQLTCANVTDWKGEPVTGGIGSVGYVTACQSKDGLIHIVTTREMHITLNEAWILQDDDAKDTMTNRHVNVLRGTVKRYRENYPDGKLKVEYGAGLGQNGRYVLHGRETWYYQTGKRQWQVNYRAGHKLGAETYYNMNGTVRWKWGHYIDGTSTWTIFNDNGSVKAKSRWEGKRFIDYKLGDQ
jgi:formylglycine-generating enzyme required for sulfatase activity